MSEVYEDFGGKRPKDEKKVKPKAKANKKEKPPVKPAVKPEPEREVRRDAVQHSSVQHSSAKHSSIAQFSAGGYELHHIGVLDGIRAVAILIVVWFHFWQQSWIMPVAGPVNLDWLPRNGAIMVDMMILLSGFCLFLPYAREMVYGERAAGTADFYVKRVARIAPSYYIAVAVALVIALIAGEYGNIGGMFGDLIPHIFFLHNWFPAASQMTHLNGVLWTVGVEVQFYLLFPLIVKYFKKNPMITYWAMVLVGLVSSWLIGHNFAVIDQSYWLNNTFTFASVYANGILGAYVYVAMTKDRKRNRAEGIFFTAAALACIWLYKILCQSRMSYISETKWQVDYRYLLSLVFLVFTVSTVLSARWFRAVWDNAVMRFLAEISFNLYIWHQYISVKLKDFHIPRYEGDVPPNMVGDTAWQWQYFIVCIVLSLAVATFMTYVVERPLAKLIRKRFSQ